MIYYLVLLFTVGVSFGLTSGVITTLGLLAGLAAGTQSRLAVIGGVATIALADALSDALGIHLSEEAENVHTAGEVWAATISTALAKLLTARYHQSQGIEQHGPHLAVADQAVEVIRPAAIDSHLVTCNCLSGCFYFPGWTE